MTELEEQRREARKRIECLVKDIIKLKETIQIYDWDDLIYDGLTVFVEEVERELDNLKIAYYNIYLLKGNGLEENKE